jgi:plastocyanin
MLGLITSDVVAFGLVVGIPAALVALMVIWARLRSKPAIWGGLSLAILAVSVAGVTAALRGGSVAAPAASPSGGCAAQAGLTGLVRDHGIASVSGSSIAMQAGDTYFSPTCVRAQPNTTLSVTLKNVGSALHNLSVPRLGINQDVPSGSTITVVIKVPSSGSVPFFCKYHVSVGMQGAFLVG